MTMTHHEINDAQFEAQSEETCPYLHGGGRLADYLADPLNSPEATKVEEHLLECLNCREFFLAIMSIRGEARMVKQMSAGAAGGGSNDARVTRLADFKKGRH